MSDVLERVKGALYFLPLIIGVLAGQPFLQIAIGCLQALICYELAKILAKDNRQLVLFSAIFIIASLSTTIYHLASGYVIGLCLVISLLMVWRVSGLFAAIFSVIVLICLSSLSVLLLFEQALFIILSLVVVIASCDIGAYFVGRMIGGPKLAPAISPGKTISGSAGGLIAAVLASLTVAPHIGMISGNPIIAGLVIGGLSQIGDLYESAFKRRIGIKDSSQMIPGHGGLLDRFDGYLLVVPLVTILLAVSAA
ncbi:MAG: phosphatidate cytidylyltransferase [Candidatus Puniceispirillaceae bacterium]